MHGHGDPLLKAAMHEDDKVAKPESDTTAKVAHDPRGQGDPLLAAATRHPPLHSELKGQVDPLMDEYLKEWGEQMKAEPKQHAMTHGEEPKRHGDPLLDEYLKEWAGQMKAEPKQHALTHGEVTGI